MSHSKRNTSSAFFTAYERSLLKTAWGSQKTRLTRESFLPFGSCQLCLMPSVDPVACLKGDLFCRECAMTNLLTQRQEIKRLDKEMEKRKELELEKEAIEDEEARARVVREFEMGLLGIYVKSTNGKNGDQKVASTPEKQGVQLGDVKSVKRKFEIDEAELMRIASEDRLKARKDIDAERKAGSKLLPSFWVPGETPDKSLTTLHDIAKLPKLQPLCPASSEAAPHNLSLKSLTAVKFTEEPDIKNPTQTVRSCPACRKALSNATKAMLAVPCGHVLCLPCSNKFQTIKEPDPHDPEAEHSILRCYVCEEDLTVREDAEDLLKDVTDATGKAKKKKKRQKDNDAVKPGLVEIRTDGTGFAGSGTNMVEKRGLAFQC